MTWLDGRWGSMTVNEGCRSMAVEVWRVGWHRFEGEDLSVCSKRVGVITQHTQSPSYIKEAPPSCTPDWEDMDLGSLGRCDGLVLSASVFLLLPCDLWELIRYDLIQAESQLSETDCAVLSRFLYCFRPEATFSSTWTSSWMNSGTRTALLYSVCCREIAKRCRGSIVVRYSFWWTLKRCRPRHVVLRGSILYDQIISVHNQCIMSQVKIHWQSIDGFCR